MHKSHKNHVLSKKTTAHYTLNSKLFTTFAPANPKLGAFEDGCSTIDDDGTSSEGCILFTSFIKTKCI